MRIRPTERQHIADILREELEQANLRISQRISEFECRPASTSSDDLDSIRRFYVDLVDRHWSEEDEEALASYAGLGEREIKRMMRDGFRRSRVYPIPSFAALMNVSRKTNGDALSDQPFILTNPDAISAAERERIANLLHRELNEAAHGIASRLKLGETKVDIVREELENVEGAIISRFTPLV